MHEIFCDAVVWKTGNFSKGNFIVDYKNKDMKEDKIEQSRIEWKKINGMDLK